MKRYNIINNTMGWLCFVIAAVTYLLTIEPTASFWDCPEFISQGAKLEVGHPPGNPIFMLAARFFVTITGAGIENAAVAVNAMSALLSAATILLLFWTITHLIKKLIVKDDASEVSLRKLLLIMGGGVCGALAYTWSDTFWFSAVEGEVYAFSSFCTALVFWLILKWENRADRPHSDRYLVLIAYIIGVSIAVHLLNLLCIPAIGLVIYYRKFKDINTKGSLIALGVSCIVVGAILYGLVPGFIEVAQGFELFFVNTVGLSYNMGVLIYAIILVTAFVWAIYELQTQRSSAAIKLSFFVAMILSGILFIGSSWLLALLLCGGLAVYLWLLCPTVPVRIFNVIALSVFVIFVGYSSYALLLIRAGANTPMNQNAPDNVFALSSYLNREQYGERPLFYGVTFAEALQTQEYPEGSGNYYVAVDDYGRPQTRVLDGYLRYDDGNAISTITKNYTKVVKRTPDEPDRYVESVEKPEYTECPDMKSLFPRIYSSAHTDGYKGWAEYATPDIDEIPQEVRARWAEQGFAPMYEVAPYMHHQTEIVTSIDADGNPVDKVAAWKPGFGVNLRYFLNYQLNHMYWRYFMWNFAGRQNDLQGNGEPHLGNWISGIPVIDNMRLGDQTYLPDEYGKGNKGHNVYYMLPLLLGLIGLLWQALYTKGADAKRGIEQFWVVFFLFFMTGIAIVLYLNQTPGQPRERDYAFAGSFYAFAIWIGIGVPAIGYLLRDLLQRFVKPRDGKGEGVLPQGAKWATVAVACAIGIAVPLQMVSQTWDDHDRSGRYTTRDFGMNYLSSVGKDGVIFCNGDNDTFPLWYAQEVEGYRTDVRVVNLSYLTTDWYANQLKHPTYEAKAVDMYATPADYRYERLAYSFVIPSDTVVDAETALRDLYKSDERLYGAPFMLYSNVVMPVNRHAAAAHYGLNPNSTDSIGLYPYLDDIRTDLSRLGSGASLGRVLSLDIVANTVKNDFSRPVYFATTVPSSYYLGLTPYLNATGMTLEVTPFASSPASPVAETAYKNIMGSFRWGGLDQPGAEKLYLDETVRRMVSSTRSAIYTVVEDLMADGEHPASEWAKEDARRRGDKSAMATHCDMARTLLNTMCAKLPGTVSLYDSMMGVYIAGLYYDLYVATGEAADLQHAEALLQAELPRYSQIVKYGASLTPSQLLRMGRSELTTMQYLGATVALLNRVKMAQAVIAKGLQLDETAAKALYSRAGVEYDLRWAALLYIDGMTTDELSGYTESISSSQAAVLADAINMRRLHDITGVPAMALTDELCKKYGIEKVQWRALLGY